MDIGEYNQRKSLPWQCKINKAIRTLEQFYRQNDGDVYISTGGIDSTLLSWLSKQSLETKNIEHVCVASVEPVENIKFNKERGDTLLKTSISKKKIIRKYGYPLISKIVAMSISRYTRTKFDWVKERRLHGYIGSRTGKRIYDGTIPLKYQPFIYAPFEFSEKCCTFTKEGPLQRWDKQSGKKPITGERAEESRERKKAYLKEGCIMNSRKTPKCTPLGAWTDQDKLACIFYNMIDYSPAYGHIARRYDGTFVQMGEPRTGCTTCGFGMIRDEERFDRLKEKKPGIYKDMMRGGEWIRKDLYRWVKLRPNSIPIWSNLYWVPDDVGYGYRFVLNYMYEVLKINKYIEKI